MAAVTLTILPFASASISFWISASVSVPRESVHSIFFFVNQVGPFTAASNVAALALVLLAGENSRILDP